MWKYFLHFIYFHHIFTAKYRWKFTHNILEAKIKHETSKVNNRTVSSMLRKIPRPWRHKGIYIYIRFSSMNILLVNFEHSSDWSEWLLRVFFIPSIPFRKIRDRGREILFYAIKLELPSWDDKEDWLTIYMKFIYI